MPGRPKMPAEKAPAKTGKKIVIIDDTEMLLIFAEDVLATADSELQIAKAFTGTDGLTQIENILPDLVLLDYSLPDINGDEVCRRLLQNEQTARIPVLMMSGHVAQMNAAAARFKNIVETIEKPFFSEALVDLVQRTLAAPLRPVERARAPTPVIPSSPVSPAPLAEKQQELARPVETASRRAARAVAPPPAEAAPPSIAAQLEPAYSGPVLSERRKRSCSGPVCGSSIDAAYAAASDGNHPCATSLVRGIAPLSIGDRQKCNSHRDWFPARRD